MKEEFRIRKKGDKYMVEKYEQGRWKGRTLFPKKVWNWIVSIEMSSNVSKSQREDISKSSEKFVHDVLSEQHREDTI